MTRLAAGYVANRTPRSVSSVDRPGHCPWVHPRYGLADRAVCLPAWRARAILVSRVRPRRFQGRSYAQPGGRVRQESKAGLEAAGQNRLRNGTCRDRTTQFRVLLDAFLIWRCATPRAVRTTRRTGIASFANSATPRGRQPLRPHALADGDQFSDQLPQARALGVQGAGGLPREAESLGCTSGRRPWR